MDTLTMIGQMSQTKERKIAQSTDGRLVKKDDIGNLIYCNLIGEIDKNKGHEGWVWLSESFLRQQWNFIN